MRLLVVNLIYSVDERILKTAFCFIFVWFVQSGFFLIKTFNVVYVQKIKIYIFKTLNIPTTDHLIGTKSKYVDSNQKCFLKKCTSHKNKLHLKLKKFKIKILV